MILTYSGKSRPSAEAIAECSDEITLNRGSRGDINYGRNIANTELNPDISNVTNKRRMRELFRDHDVPMPRLYSEAEVCDIYVSGRSTPLLVGRPDRHMKKRGFWKVNSLNSLNRALLGTRRKKAATHFMEWVDAPREYRVHIFKGKSIRISEKQFDEYDKTDYVTMKPTHRVEHVRRAAKKAVEAVGLDFGAVDVMADDENCWVLEVNAAPGLGGSMPELYGQTFETYMRGDW